MSETKDYRMSFLTALENNVSSFLDEEQLHRVVNVAIKTLSDYEIVERCTELALLGTENEKTIKKYCACLYVDGKSEKTISQYKRTANKLSDFLQKPFTDMGAYDIRYFLACEKERGISNRSLENTRANLSAFFQWMTAEEIIPKNPVLNINPIKFVDEVRKPFSETEIDMLRGACRNLKERALLEMLLSSGVRVSELSQMNVQDIEMDTLTVHVRHGKGGKERITYITSVCGMHLKRYLDARQENGELLFYNLRHEQLLPGGIRHILNELAKRAKVENVHPHRFRRTFATGLANRGMDIQEIQRLLGHSKIDTTLEYVCVDDRRVKSSYMKYIA